MNGLPGTKARASAPAIGGCPLIAGSSGGGPPLKIFQMHDEIETMFERFEVVWPPEIADGRKPLNGAIGK